MSPYWTIHSAGEALDRWLLHPVLYPLWFLQALMTCMVLSPLVYVAVRALRWWVLVIAVVWWVSGWQPMARLAVDQLHGVPALHRGRRVRDARRPGAVGARRAPAWLVAAFAAAWLAAAAALHPVRPRPGPLDARRPAPGGRSGHLCPLDGPRRAQTASTGVYEPHRRRRAALDPRTGGWRTRLAAAALFVAPLSFFVYVTQEPALAVFKHLVETAGSGLPVLVAYLAPPLLVITGSVLVGLALRRLLPRTFAVAAGGRVPGAPRGRAPADPEAAVETSS